MFVIFIFYLVFFYVTVSKIYSFILKVFFPKVYFSCLFDSYLPFFFSVLCLICLEFRNLLKAVFVAQNKYFFLNIYFICSHLWD